MSKADVDSMTLDEMMEAYAAAMMFQEEAKAAADSTP